MNLPRIFDCKGGRVRSSHLFMFFAGMTYPAAAVLGQVQFDDVTIGSGVEYTGESYGASWGDANGDRLPDLFVTHHRNPPGLYINLGDGTFENRAFEVDAWQLTPRSDIHGGTWADYNNDGHSDLMITAGSKNFTQFLVNNGSFLSDRISDFTFDRMAWGGRFPFWFDYDNDGLLDLGVVVQGDKVQLHVQENGDFLRSNSASGHECEDGDYSMLSDLTLDGRADWVCVNSGAAPERIYDFTVGTPFLDRSDLAVSVGSIADVAIADFDRDLIMDIFALRGKVRISGGAITGPQSIEAHLQNTGGSASGITFRSSGNLSVELHWSGPNVNNVFIGSGGLHPPVAQQGEPIRMTLSASDPNVHGLMPYNPATDRGVFVGYDPTTQTWTYVNSANSGGAFSYTYSYIDSSAPVSNLGEFGIAGNERPTQPAMLKYSGSAYTNQIGTTGLNHGVLCNAVAAADFDNDMDVDLYYVCREAVNNIANRLYLNDGTGQFVPAPATFGAQGPTGSGVGLGENVVASDYDVDGSVDLFVTNGLKLYPLLAGYDAGGPDKLFRNRGNDNHWIELDLTGITSNRDGIGAIVTATAGGTAQKRERNGGYHRWAQHDNRLHFGLGPNTLVNITVQWPSGQLDTFFDVAADKLYEVVEGDPVLNPITVPGSTDPSACVRTAGIPSFNIAVDREMFIWRDNCASQDWSVRVTGGTGPSFTYSGRLVSDVPINNVSGFNLEASDTLALSGGGTALEYALIVGSSRQDGFTFTLDPEAGGCFGQDGNSDVAYGGSMRTPLSLPIDLRTLEPCSAGAQTSISIADVSVSEDVPGGIASFVVSLNGSSTEVVTVDFQTADGSASAPADYTAAAGNVDFAPGETSKVIEVQIIDDATTEPVETFTLTLGNPSGALLNDFTATGTIVDNEPSTCGAPNYNRATEHALFVWQDCATGVWSVRVTAGGQNATFSGDISASQPFDSVTPFSIEGQDLFDLSDPTAISYGLAVGNAGQDGFEFSIPGGAKLCLDLTSPAAPVLLGENRTSLSVPVDLSTLGACSTPAVADLVTTKAVSSDPTPAEGEVVTYLVTVTNNGPLDATNVSLADNLPAGLTPTGNNGSVTQGNYLGGTWEIGSLPVSASATLTIEGIVDAGQAGQVISNSTSAAAGDELDAGSAGDELAASVRVEGSGGTPLVNWSGASGGVSTAGNQIVYSGSPTGWNNNTVVSPAFSTLGYTSNYEVSFTIDSNPAATTWVVGLGVAETGATWRDVDYGLRSSTGELKVYESGTWRTTTAVLAAGDVISIAVSPGLLDYRLNGVTFWSTAYAGAPDFYVDTSFNSGAITLGAFVAADP